MSLAALRDLELGGAGHTFPDSAPVSQRARSAAGLRARNRQGAKSIEFTHRILDGSSSRPSNATLSSIRRRRRVCHHHIHKLPLPSWIRSVYLWTAREQAICAEHEQDGGGRQQAESQSIPCVSRRSQSRGVQRATQPPKLARVLSQTASRHLSAGGDTRLACQSRSAFLPHRPKPVDRSARLFHLGAVTARFGSEQTPKPRITTETRQSAEKGSCLEFVEGRTMLMMLRE